MYRVGQYTGRVMTSGHKLLHNMYITHVMYRVGQQTMVLVSINKLLYATTWMCD